MKAILMSKVWLITGSSRGLGRAPAEAVIAGGHKLAATAGHLAQLADLADRQKAREASRHAV
jgi:NAD(P)-dependent dehydrogenase (short-subunit alcohol dehydrogenase family)